MDIHSSHKPIVPLDQKIALSVEEAVSLTPYGRSTIYEAMKQGALPARKNGRRTYIMRDDLDRFLRSNPEYRPNRASLAANS